MLMNIMIVTNSRYLEPAYVMLYSLFENHPEEPMDIYLPYEDLSGRELEELTEFVASFAGKKLYPLYVGTEFKQRVTSKSGINIETYYRIVGAELLPADMERILYLDVDMVVKGALTELYHADLTGHPFAVCEDIYGIINGFHSENKARLGIPEEYTYFNAGVMLYNLSYLRTHDGVNRMLEAIYQNYERYIYNDQDVMNELYYDKLLYLGWDEYNCPPAWYYVNKTELGAGRLRFADYNTLQREADKPEFVETYQNVTRQIYENARIVHYLGDTKPWSKTRKQATLYDMFDEVYGEYYSRMKIYRQSLRETGNVLE